jgi:hypothetical protein
MTTGFVVHCETLAIWWLSTPSHLLNIDVVLPTFEAHGIEVNTVLSDNGREFCGRMGRHPYELFLQLEGIEHRKTRVKCRNPTGSSSASIARCSNEHFRVEGRRRRCLRIQVWASLCSDAGRHFAIAGRPAKLE